MDHIAIRLHSPRTLSNPRTRKWRYPARHLSVPNGCSANALRRPIMSSPARPMRARWRSITSSSVQRSISRRWRVPARQRPRSGQVRQTEAKTGIADGHLAAGLTLLPVHRPQLRIGRTAIDIGRGVVAEVLDTEPALRFQSLAAIDRAAEH